MMYVSMSLMNFVIIFSYLTYNKTFFENYGRDISSVTVNKIHSKYLDTEDVRDLQRNRR